MTKTQEELIRKLRELAKMPVILEAATVKEVDEEQLTCTVAPLDGPEVFDVRLKAAIDGISDGLVQIPTVGSTVLTCLIGNDENTRVIILFSSVEKTVFNGGEKGGLINIQTLIEQLNKTNEVVNVMKDALTSWNPVPNDGGAALKLMVSTNMAGKQTGTFDNMEDTKVLH